VLVRAEGADHTADVVEPGTDVAVARGRGVVADLELDVEAELAEVAGQPREVLDPRLAVGLKEAVQAHRHRPIAAQLAEPAVALALVLGDDRRGLRAPGFAGEARPDPELEPRAAGRSVVGVALIAVGVRAQRCRSLGRRDQTRLVPRDRVGPRREGERRHEGDRDRPSQA
jgi:hypothetical protein